MKSIKNTLIALVAFAGLAGVAVSADDSAVHNKQVDWSFNGPFGTIDKQSAQRGFQVYREVCSSCHSLKYFKFRNLADLGYGNDMIKAFAAEYTVAGDIDSFGDPTERAGLPQDAFPSPFANDNAARASNGGALPPDLSLVAKSRADGPNYLYSLLTGYDDAPSGVELGEGMNYNAYFPGNQIAMAEPIFDDHVEYSDGTAATQDQIAKDISMFLMYVAEPKLDARHTMGLNVMLFLLVLTIIFYLSMKKIWAPVKRGDNIIGD